MSGVQVCTVKADTGYEFLLPCSTQISCQLPEKETDVYIPSERQIPFMVDLEPGRGGRNTIILVVLD